MNEEAPGPFCGVFWKVVMLEGSPQGARAEPWLGHRLLKPHVGVSETYGYLILGSL